MYDIIFISYNEPNADANFARLQARFTAPTLKRVHGVDGIHNAHIAAAKKAMTKMFWVVDGDAEVLDTFDFSYQVPNNELDHVHVWRSINPINDLEYGYGGVKLLPKKLTMNMMVANVDMTTSISDLFKPMPEVSNVTRFNTDPFATWRSAFRECVKLSSNIIDRQDDIETLQRLVTWCSFGDDREYGIFSIAGALAGKSYGEKNASNLEALEKINDFDWLLKQFTLQQVDQPVERS
jgi:hypothetical protein